LALVKINVHCFLEILRVDCQAPILASGKGHPAGKLNCGRHDEAVVVICVFANQVNSPGRTEEARRLPEKLTEGRGEREHERFRKF
jgi:hypothetical protein